MIFACGLWSPRDRLAQESTGAVSRELARHRVASWDFSLKMDTDEIIDVAPLGLHGKAVNSPMRAVTGASWGGEEQRSASAPAEYTAIHFHQDDLDDAAWEESFRIVVPESGQRQYATRSSAVEDRIPFFVTSVRRPESRGVLLSCPDIHIPRLREPPPVGTPARERS